MFLEESDFVLGKAILIGGVSLEWQRIKRILRMLLMIDIIAAILPVNELGPILALLLARSVTRCHRFLLLVYGLHLEAFVVCPVSG